MKIMIIWIWPYYLIQEVIKIQIKENIILPGNIIQENATLYVINKTT